MRLPLADRFWSKVDRNGPVHPIVGTACWLWTASLDHNGYGKFWVPSTDANRRRCVQAHRLAWELMFDKIPEGQCALHRCDNPLCVNPGHVFLGSMLDNVADMDAKGRRVNASSLKSQCPKGHPYDVLNTRYEAGKRVCRTCRYEARQGDLSARRVREAVQARKYYWRKRGQTPPAVVSRGS